MHVAGSEATMVRACAVVSNDNLWGCDDTVSRGLPATLMWYNSWVSRKKEESPAWHKQNRIDCDLFLNNSTFVRFGTLFADVR